MEIFIYYRVFKMIVSGLDDVPSLILNKYKLIMIIEIMSVNK